MTVGYNTPSRLFNFNDVPPSEGLISAWNLASTADAFGTNTLTNNNSVTFVAGKIGNCASFDGISKYLSKASNSDLQFGAGKTLSLCFWFKLNALPGSTKRARLVGKWNTLNNQEYLVDVLDTGEARFSISRIGSDLNQLMTGAGVIVANVWYFICVWYDGTKMYLELNASGNIFSAAYALDIFAGNSDFCIGGDGTADRWTNGFVDSVRLYKHTNRCLTANERSAIYNLGLGREFVSSNTISSDEVNRELNQIINIFNGITTDITPKISVTSNDAALSVNQQGSGPILQCYNNGILKAEVNNNGTFVSKLATGTAPITIASAATSVIPNLNVDLLDGLHSSSFLQVGQFLTFCDSTSWSGNLVVQDKIVGLSGQFVVGFKIYCRTLPSNDSLITFGIYNQAGTLLGTCTLNNTLNLNTFVVGTPPDLYGGRITIKVLTLIGSTPPQDVTVSVISTKSYI